MYMICQVILVEHLQFFQGQNYNNLLKAQPRGECGARSRFDLGRILSKIVMQS